MNHQLPVLEIVATSGRCAQRATRAGADRIEACQGLELGGLTPSPEVLEQILEFAPQLGVHALLRSRPGDFYYTGDEAQIMQRQAVRLARAGVHGLVLGALDRQGQLDLPLMLRWAQAALEINPQMDIVVHRAIDASANPVREVKRLRQLPVRRILTSGGQKTVADGFNTIAQMLQQAGDDVQIMCGGGLRGEDLAAACHMKVAGVHFSAKTSYADTIEVSEQEVRELRRTLDELSN